MAKYKWLFIYLASLIFGLGGWMVALPTWHDAASPAAVGGCIFPWWPISSAAC